MSYVFNNLKFLLKEEEEDPTGGLLGDDEAAESDESAEDETDPFAMSSDDEEAEADANDEVAGDEGTENGSDSVAKSNAEAAKDVMDMLDKADNSLNNVTRIVSPGSLDVVEALKNKNLSAALLEGPWDSAIKKSEEFEEKLKIIKKPYEDFFDAKADFDIEEVARKAAKLFLKFDSLVDKYEIVKYFANIDIALNGPEDRGELQDLLEDFEVLLENFIKEGGGELQNPTYTLDVDKQKIAVGATSSGG